MEIIIVKKILLLTFWAQSYNIHFFSCIFLSNQDDFYKHVFINISLKFSYVGIIRCNYIVEQWMRSMKTKSISFFTEKELQTNFKLILF